MFNKETFVGKTKGNLTDHYFIKEGIGQGSYGKVFQVKHKDSGITRACKQLAIKQIQNYEKFMLEISILAQMDHPNIIRAYEFYQDDQFFYIVTDYCQGGELFDRILIEKNFSE